MRKEASMMALMMQKIPMQIPMLNSSNLNVVMILVCMMRVQMKKEFESREVESNSSVEFVRIMRGEVDFDKVRIKTEPV